MTLYLGSAPVNASAFYAGTTAIDRIYAGEVEIWNSGGTPTPTPTPKKIAGVGDSTIAEYPTGNGIVPVPALIAGVTPTTLAVPGHTINQQLAVWNAVVDKTVFDAVVVQIGLNDVTNSGDASAAITRLQNLIDVIRSGIRSDSKLLISKMLPCRQRWYDVFGSTGGAVGQSQWVEINTAIMNTIINVDGRISAHVPLLDDGNGNLAPAYDTGDHIHENNAGRQIIANAWRNGLITAGVLS